MMPRRRGGRTGPPRGRANATAWSPTRRGGGHGNSNLNKLRHADFFLDDSVCAGKLASCCLQRTIPQSCHAHWHCAVLESRARSCPDFQDSLQARSSNVGAAGPYILIIAVDSPRLSAVPVLRGDYGVLGQWSFRFDRNSTPREVKFRRSIEPSKPAPSSGEGDGEVRPQRASDPPWLWKGLPRVEQRRQFQLPQGLASCKGCEEQHHLETIDLCP